MISCQEIKSGMSMTSNVRDVLSKRVLDLRNDYSLTQEQLGERIKRSQGNIADIEKKRRGVSLDILVELSNLFEVSIDYLLGVTDEPERYGKQEDQAVFEIKDEREREIVQELAKLISPLSVDEKRQLVDVIKMLSTPRPPRIIGRE